MEVKNLKIKSNNPDYAGTWNKEDVEEEIKECYGSIPAKKNEWIQFILDMAIDGKVGYEQGKLLEQVANNDFIREIKIDLEDGFWVRIIKS